VRFRLACALHRGLIANLSPGERWTPVENDDRSVYRDVTIKLQAEDRSEVVVTLTLRSAWTAALRFSPLNAGGDE